MTTLAPVLQLPTSPSLNPLALVAQRCDGLLLRANRKYDVRVEIGSSTVEDQPYVVARNRETGSWSCGCPGYTRGRNRARDKELPCKHLKELVPPLRLALELQELTLPMPGGVWQHPGEVGQTT